MQLLLVFLLASVTIGLVTDRLDRRVYTLIVAGAAFTTMLFYGMGRWWA